jgi:putative transposase
MPWLDASPMTERQRFITDYEGGLFTMTELCERYAVSRKTGYKWLRRYAEHGRQGLGDQSRAPHRCPHKIADDVAQAICEMRRAHPSWGPCKLLRVLAARKPGMELPAISTAGDLLVREGLVKKRIRRRRHLHPGSVPAVTAQPNDIWTADSKVISARAMVVTAIR